MNFEYHPPNCSRFKTMSFKPIEGFWTWSMVREMGMLVETEHLIGFWDKPGGGKLHFKPRSHKFFVSWLDYKKSGELQELYEKAVKPWRKRLSFPK